MHTLDDIRRDYIGKLFDPEAFPVGDWDGDPDDDCFCWAEIGDFEDEEGNASFIRYRAAYDCEETENGDLRLTCIHEIQKEMLIGDDAMRTNMEELVVKAWDYDELYDRLAEAVVEYEEEEEE